MKIRIIVYLYDYKKNKVYTKNESFGFADEGVMEKELRIYISYQQA